MKATSLFVSLWLATLACAQEGGGGDEVTRHNSVIAHGTIMGFAFGFVFPVGAILIRTTSFRRLPWVHAGIQMFAYILALTGLGLGVYIAIKPESQLTASNGHPIIGIIVIGALLFQPIGGLIHHYKYAHQGKRTFWAKTHVWWGRLFITVGIINGGLGLMLSGNTIKGEIAYGVIAGVIWCIWVAVSTWSVISTRGAADETGEKALGSSAATSENGTDRNGESMTAT